MSNFLDWEKAADAARFKPWDPDERPRNLNWSQRNGDGCGSVPPELSASEQPDETETVGLNIIDAGEDDWNVPPREWLLGNIFCRESVSTLLADGGTGKTALRYAQYLSLAIGRPLTGEHVFQRCRVLVVSLEDSIRELRRRMKAACLHHGVPQAELKGWLFYIALGASGGKLMVADAKGRPVIGPLAADLEKSIVERKADLVGLDPFVKTHAVEENSNSAVDDVVQILSDMAVKHSIAVDTPHHTSKGLADPGNANRGRGASAMKDAARLVYTLSPMTGDEAKALAVGEAERRLLIRMDSGKVNNAPPSIEAKWFRLVGVPLGNATDLYPNGDTVQTVEPWTPTDVWAALTSLAITQILNDLEAGLPDGNLYTDGPNVTDRAAWRVVTKHSPATSEGGARQVVKTWVKSGLLIRDEYENPATRKTVWGFRVDNTKRPT